MTTCLTSKFSTVTQICVRTFFCHLIVEARIALPKQQQQNSFKQKIR